MVEIIQPSGILSLLNAILIIMPRCKGNAKSDDTKETELNKTVKG